MSFVRPIILVSFSTHKVTETDVKLRVKFIIEVIYASFYVVTV